MITTAVLIAAIGRSQRSPPLRLSEGGMNRSVASRNSAASRSARAIPTLDRRMDSRVHMIRPQAIGTG
jgi:hypothetical protein